MESIKKISIITPIFNEENSVEIFHTKISKILSNISDISFELIFINDGSTDGTLNKILRLRTLDPRIIVIDLSRNFGKEAALTAGLDTAVGDAIIPIDVDLQDPPELIIDLIAKWREGHLVVLGRRVNRETDSLIKEITAKWFYKFHNSISSIKIPENVGDFRLMDKKVVDELKRLPESNRFMKGLFSWVGFDPVYINYKRPHRSVGMSKFNLIKLFNLAIEGITSFSILPLRIWSIIGTFISGISFIFSIFIILKYFITGIEVPGYASLMVALTFIGGLQLIGIGVLGEYLGRIYIEVKQRPKYIIKNIHKEE